MMSNENVALTNGKSNLINGSKHGSKEFVYKCNFSQCNKVFGKKSRLVLHERTHTGERPFKCSHDGCNKSYTRCFHLTRHVTKTHNEDVSITEYLSCDLCENTYSNKYSLQKHKKTHETAPYSCSTCGKSFRKQQQYEAHNYEHTGVKPYKCEHPGCDKNFLVHSRLQKHTEIHVPNRYKCYYHNCSRAFNGFNLYRKHLTKDHPKVCIECHEEFSTNRKLNIHLKTHQEKEIFQCPFAPCDKYYFYESNLKAHIKTNHDANFHGFKCTTCDKDLSSKQKLNQHMKTHSSNYQRHYKSHKPRRTRKDKGVRKRSIYSVLSGYDDSQKTVEKVVPSSTVCETTQDDATVSWTSKDICDSVVAMVSSKIRATLQI